MKSATSALWISLLAASAAAKTTLTFTITAAGSPVNGLNITAGPTNPVAGQSLGAFASGTKINWSVNGGEVRDDNSSHGRDFDASLVGPTGGPYQFVGLLDASKATVPAGDSKIFNQWTVGAQLKYTAEPGQFWATETADGSGDYSITFAASAPVGGIAVNLTAISVKS